MSALSHTVNKEVDVINIKLPEVSIYDKDKEMQYYNPFECLPLKIILERG